MAEPGWYDDPHGGGGQRWWDGTRWTEHATPPPQPGPQPGEVPPPPGAADASGVATAAGTTTSVGSSSGAGAGKVIGLVVGALVLLVVLAVVVWLLLGSGGDSASAGQLTAGDTVSYEVEESGSFELDFSIDEGLVVIDVRGTDSFDPVATLFDADTDEEIARNDDRSSEHLERYGGDRLDSLLELELPAGDYRLVVTGFAGQGGPGVVTFPVVGG